MTGSAVSASDAAGSLDPSPNRGDSDLAAVGAVLADASRCRMLLALDDGRALPASRLAAEAGVAASTASGHLARLREAGMVVVEQRGRHRYYRLSGPLTGQLIELLAAFAPGQPVRGLRQSKRADALRDGRTCYDHLAGRLGVRIMAALIEAGHVTGGDGRYHPERDGNDERAGWGQDVDYELSGSGAEFFAAVGVRLPANRRVMRYCIDWTEQRHHLSGGAGRGVLDRLLDLGWVVRYPQHRAVRVTAPGREGLREQWGVELSDALVR